MRQWMRAQRALSRRKLSTWRCSVDFDFSPDQIELREHVRKFFDDACPLAEVRHVLDGMTAYASGVWEKISALGYLGAAIPEQYGGLGLGHLELCVIAEEIGRAL